MVPERAWMRGWVFSAWVTAPVRTKRTRLWAKRTRLWAKTGDCGRAARQIARRRAVT